MLGIAHIAYFKMCMLNYFTPICKSHSFLGTNPHIHVYNVLK